MLINDLVALLMKVPPMLASAWAAWFFVGLLLSIWQRREQGWMVVVAPAPKHKSGVRPPSAPRAQKAPVATPPSSGDPFGELEALLEPTPSGMHRRPGDLDMSPSPVLQETSRPLAAPQSLP